MHASEVDNTTIRTVAGSSFAKRRVLHVINGEHYSGAERVQDLLGLCLPELGYDVAFACLKPDLFPLKRQSHEATLYEVPMKWKFDLRAARTLAKIVKLGGFDLLHAHTVRSVLVTRIASMLARVPFFYHVHSPTSNDSTRKLTNRINASIERISLSGVSQLICVSHGLARHMESQRYKPGLISVVPNGVPGYGFQERDTPSVPWVIGTIALFRPRKGTEVLIEALAILRQQGHDVRLHAVGPFETSGYEQKIKSLAVHHQVEDAVDWRGFTSDIDAELERMDVMVLPSLFGEGLPMVILEAMAVGVPVVGTNVPGVPEVLSDESGLIAKPGCPQDLAHCIGQLIRGDRDWTAIRENAWLRQTEHYSDQSMAAGVAAIYERFLAGEENEPRTIRYAPTTSP